MTLGSACEHALIASARGAASRQQVRAAARAFVRRHCRDTNYLAWVVRSVAARSALAGTFTVHYFPEPARGSLVGAGAALIVLLGRARRRQRR